MLPIQEALQLIAKNVSPADSETVTLAHACYRVLASPVNSDIDSPPYNKSIMDGFAVVAADIENGVELNVLETVPAGSTPTQVVQPGTASRIMTGAPMPKGADAVIMIEQTDFDETANKVRILADESVAGKHVMMQAAAMATGETVLDSGHRIRPQDIGLLAECGAASVEVRKQPSLAVMPTGDELVDCSQFPGPGMIRNSNGPMLLALAAAQSDQVTDLGVGKDDRSDLSQKVARGLESNFLVLSGGVSAGMLDLVPEVLVEQGVQQVFHKVAVKPGKPVWFGIKESKDKKSYVFGLPGNPVSSLVCFNLFVRAAIEAWYGNGIEQSSRLSPAVLASDHEVRGNRTTYWPVTFSDSRDQRMVEPVSWRGSSDLRALGKADALGIFPVEDGPIFQKGSNILVMNLN